MTAISTDEATKWQTEGAALFLDSWRFRTAEMLPWSDFNRDRILVALQEHTRMTYIAARRAARIEPPEHGWVERFDGQVWVPRSCNKHDDCDAADARDRARGRFVFSHCHADDCDECFGS